MRVGDLYVADFGGLDVRGYEQAGTRPALIVHSDEFLRIPSLALVCPLTTRARGVPNHVPVVADDRNRLKSDCFVMTEQLRAIDRRFLLGYIGAVSPAVTHTVLAVIRSRLLAAP